ncbi:hypothetical protein MY7_1636 [Bacillus sp. 5B6]|nr:hypothetical protein MY7_1636 [Bacillus sp. 5B6]
MPQVFKKQLVRSLLICIISCSVHHKFKFSPFFIIFFKQA